MNPLNRLRLKELLPSLNTDPRRHVFNVIEALAKVGRPIPREREPKQRTKLVVTAKIAVSA